MNQGWWWPGFLIELAIFLTVVLGFTWLLMNWMLRQLDKRDLEIHELEENQKAFEDDMKRRLWMEDEDD